MSPGLCTTTLQSGTASSSPLSRSAIHAAWSRCASGDERHTTSTKRFFFTSFQYLPGLMILSANMSWMLTAVELRCHGRTRLRKSTDSRRLTNTVLQIFQVQTNFTVVCMDVSTRTRVQPPDQAHQCGVQKGNPSDVPIVPYRITPEHETDTRDSSTREEPCCSFLLRSARVLSLLARNAPDSS